MIHRLPSDCIAQIKTHLGSQYSLVLDIAINPRWRQTIPFRCTMYCDIENVQAHIDWEYDLQETQKEYNYEAEYDDQYDSDEYKGEFQDDY
jgi:hypothetical protein